MAVTPAQRANIDRLKESDSRYFQRRRDIAIGRSKTTEEQRLEIMYRRFEGESSRDLALEYGISRARVDSLGKRERP